MHCVARTCSTSDVPMPNAIAPTAPCVAVWLSPQTMIMPRLGASLLRPDDMDDALRLAEHVEVLETELVRVPLHRFQLGLRYGVGQWLVPVTRRYVVIRDGDSLVETAYSAVCSAGGRRTLAARSLRGQGEGLRTAERVCRNPRARRGTPISSRTSFSGPSVPPLVDQVVKSSSKR